MNEDIIKAIAECKPVWFRTKGMKEWSSLTSGATISLLRRSDVEWRLYKVSDDLPWEVQAAINTNNHSKVYKKGWLDCCMALKPELKQQCETARKELE